MGKTAAITVRLKPEDLTEINRRAQANGLSRTSYITQTALGVLYADPDEPIRRLDALEQRLQRVEEAREASGW